MSRPSARRALASALAAAAALVLVSCGNPSPIVALPSVDPASPGTPSNPFPSVGASSTPSADPPPAEPDHLSVALAGDVLVHTGVWQTAQRDAARRGERLPDFRPMFAGVKDQIAPADLAICHMETPLSARPGPTATTRSSPRRRPCSTASSRPASTGARRRPTTPSTRASPGWSARSTRSTAATSPTPARSPRAGLLGSRWSSTSTASRSGLISMTFGTNGLPVTEPWSVNLIDVPKAIAQARAMHRHGVDIVMVAVHAGDEYSHAPSAQQVEVFHALPRSPYVDFVYGHHSHVVEPIEKVDGKWAVYGLGQLRGPAGDGDPRHLPRSDRPRGLRASSPTAATARRAPPIRRR